MNSEHPLGIIITPGCKKYVLSVLTPFHLTTCRSGSKASFFPIKVRVSCAQYEQHEIDDLSENAHTNASDHLKTTFRLFVMPWHRVDTIIQHLVIPAFIPILLIFTVFNKMSKCWKSKSRQMKKENRNDSCFSSDKSGQPTIFSQVLRSSQANATAPSCPLRIRVRYTNLTTEAFLGQ